MSPNSRPTCNIVKDLQNVDYSQIILLFILSWLFYLKLNKIVQKEKSSNLPMVSESLTLTFNLLIVYYSSLLAFGSVTSFFWKWSVLELSGFCVFIKDESTDLRKNFF